MRFALLTVLGEHTAFAAAEPVKSPPPITDPQHPMLMKVHSLVSPSLLGLGLLLAGCAEKTPYAKLSEQVTNKAGVAKTYGLQPLPVPHPYLNIGDVITPTETIDLRGNKQYALDNFDVVASPMRMVAQYHHPDDSAAAGRLVNNIYSHLGELGKDETETNLDGKTVASFGAVYKNSPLEAKGNLLREKSYDLKIKVPFLYLKPERASFDEMLADLGSGEYEPLKKGRDGQSLNRNYTALRKKIQSRLARVSADYADSIPLYAIDAIIWSDSLEATLVSKHRNKIDADANKDLGLAEIADAVVGAPSIKFERDKSDNSTVKSTRGRTHWGYQAWPLKKSANGTLQVDRTGRPLLLRPNWRKVKK